MGESFLEDRSVLSRGAREPDQSLSYGSHKHHVADVWYAAGQGAARPLVIMIHGGFWRPDYDRAHTAPLCAAIADAGWTVATIEYRRVPHQPDVMVDDVSRAVAALPAQVRGHDGTAVLLGHSAGGHLCLLAAAKRVFANTRGAVALGPAADLQWVDQLNLDNGAVRDFLGSPAAQRTDLDPARLPAAPGVTIILHGEQDEIVPISVSRAFVMRHPLTRLIGIDQCGHFALIDPASSAWPLVLSALADASA